MTVETDAWRQFRTSIARRAPCVGCGMLSPWKPVGWRFRYVPITGGTRTDQKVKTERLCPSCYNSNSKEEVPLAPVGVPLEGELP